MTAPPRTPLQIGVTGGIGSGKSVVCQIFACLGVPVYEADVRAIWLADHHPAIRREVTDLLGPGAYGPDGSYQRGYVAGRVFGDAGLLQKLNKIIHPRVFADSEQWLLNKAGHPYVVREAALMNRAGEGNTMDKVLVVTAPVPLRLERIRRRDPQRSEEQIQAIMARQVPDETRIGWADHVIDNSGGAAVIPQVLRLHALFLEEAAG